MSGAAQRLVFGKVDSYRVESRFLDEVSDEFAQRYETDSRGSGQSRHFGMGSGSAAGIGGFSDRLYDNAKHMMDISRKAGKERPAKSEPAAPVASGVFSGGERVKHKKYGEGMVVGVKKEGRDEMITIIFDEFGTKVFDASIVKLKKL